MNAQKMSYLFLKENLDAFKILKQATLIIEENSHEYAIAPMNEQRAILFHLFKMIEDDSDVSVNENFYAAKEHLYRALYDTLAILQSQLIKSIKNISDKYKVGTISLIYPALYQELEPKITLIQQKISSLRSERPSHYPNINIDETWAYIIFLISEKDKLKSMIPTFEQHEFEQKEKQKKENRFRIMLGLATAAIGAMVALLVKLYIK